MLPVDQPTAAPEATIAAVQGDVPHARTLANELLRATTVTANHAAATEGLAAQVRSRTRAAPGLVIWPENSTDLDPALYPLVLYATIATRGDRHWPARARRLGTR